MQAEYTLALAPLLVGAIYGWRDLVRRYERDVERRAGCQHPARYRLGDRHNRTEHCDDCGSQWPIKQVRCPKCRKWSDPDEV